MPKRDEKPASGAGPPRQDELPPTATELEERVAALEEERLAELGLVEMPDPPAPGAAPSKVAYRDWLDNMLAGE